MWASLLCITPPKRYYHLPFFLTYQALTHKIICGQIGYKAIFHSFCFLLLVSYFNMKVICFNIWYSTIRLLGPLFDGDRSPIRRLLSPIRQLSVLIPSVPDSYPPVLIPGSSPWRIPSYALFEFLG